MREQDVTSKEAHGQLLAARAMMVDALRVLDERSHSAAAASLDLALHHLDCELGIIRPAT